MPGLSQDQMGDARRCQSDAYPESTEARDSDPDRVVTGSSHTFSASKLDDQTLGLLAERPEVTSKQLDQIVAHPNAGAFTLRCAAGNPQANGAVLDQILLHPKVDWTALYLIGRDPRRDESEPLAFGEARSRKVDQVRVGLYKRQQIS